MKKILISSALAALMVAPSLGFEVYNADETKVDVYGSIRGYVGAGMNPTFGDTIPSPTGVGSKVDGQSTGYLIGLQDNSQFGVKFSSGKFKANIEFGAAETGINGSEESSDYRQFWGSYTTDFGTFLFGKTNTPTIDNGFTADWVNNDNGGNGFGFIATGSRRIQFQYNIGGFTLALVEDTVGAGRNKTDRYNMVTNPNTNTTTNEYVEANEDSPRIAAAYEIKDEKKKPFFKIAGTYRHYSPSSVERNKSASAYHGWVAVKPSFGNMFISVMAHYGKNGHLYGEQRTNFSTGGFSHNQINAGLDAKRLGGRIEFGVNFTKEVGLVLGGGYTTTFDGAAQVGVNDASINSIGAFIQLPYKINKNFNVIPQVSYYDTKSKSGSTLVNGGSQETGVIAGARIRWDF